MFQRNIAIILRRLNKNRGYTFINILGLSVSIASVLVILMILTFDLRFDNYHKDADHIYRLTKLETTNGEISFDTGMPYPLKESFKDDFQEVELLVFVDNSNIGGILKVGNDGSATRYHENAENIAYVTPDYFELFNYDFIAGDINTALDKPNTIVITKTLAEKYFGEYSTALNKTINLDNTYDFVVTGIIAEPPRNTDLPFNILMSFDTGGKERIWDSWSATSSANQVFIKVNTGVKSKDFGNKIKEYIQDRKDQNDPSIQELLLQPLSEMHHNADYATYTQRVATYSEMYTLAAIALLILITASINFINLNTALAVRRSKEIGVRKTLGSSRGKLIVQFLTETGLITFISIVAALGLAEIAAFKIDLVIGYTLPPTAYDLQLLVVLSMIFLAVTLLSGLYPALILSGFKPVQALKNKITYEKQGSLSLRKSLIVVQLVISQILVVAVIVVSQQVDHFLNQPMGIDTEAIVEFSMPDPTKSDHDAFRSQVLSLSGVKNVTFSNTGTASENTWGGYARMTLNNEEVAFSTAIKIIDPQYLETYGLNLLAGRNLKATSDSLRYYLVNETLVSKMGIENMEDALGQPLRVWGVDGSIVGVVEDYHTVSLHYEIEPVAMWYSHNQRNRAAVKLENGNWNETLTMIETIWQDHNPEYIYSYQFLDDQLAQFYENEQRLSKTFTLFASVALFIGAIGLLGLMSYMVATKTKEIGVRKVLGAKVIQLMQLLSSDFIVMVVFAFIVTVPVSWYLMSKWLEEFASRIEMNIWIFLSALVFSLLITLFTVGYQSLKAAVANPIDSLRDE